MISILFINSRKVVQSLLEGCTKHFLNSTETLKVLRKNKIKLKKIEKIEQSTKKGDNSHGLIFITT